jgi:hypothetical protein
MTALERLKALLPIVTWRDTEKWLTVAYLGFQLLLMFINPIASIAMGIFLISVLLAANNF